MASLRETKPDTFKKKIDIFRPLYTKAGEYTFFSSTHGTFSKIEHTLGYKISLNTFKKTEIISSIFSNHNGMK